MTIAKYIVVSAAGDKLYMSSLEEGLSRVNMLEGTVMRLAYWSTAFRFGSIAWASTFSCWIELLGMTRDAYLDMQITMPQQLLSRTWKS